MVGSKEAWCERQVKNVLSAYFAQGRRIIESDSRLVEDLYVDSMGMVEIVMALNQAFGVELAEAAVAQWKTVGDICRSVEMSAVVSFAKSNTAAKVLV